MCMRAEGASFLLASHDIAYINVMPIEVMCCVHNVMRWYQCDIITYHCDIIVLFCIRAPLVCMCIYKMIYLVYVLTYWRCIVSIGITLIYTMQHTATHCNTLQHTATHCIICCRCTSGIHVYIQNDIFSTCACDLKAHHLCWHHMNIHNVSFGICARLECMYIYKTMHLVYVRAICRRTTRTSIARICTISHKSAEVYYVVYVHV